MNLHIGNVAEFNEQFDDDLPIEMKRSIRQDCDVYAGITPFLSDEPVHIVVPRSVEDDRWWDLLMTTLRWEGVEVHELEVPDDGNLCEVLGASSTLRRVLSRAATPLHFIPWGETPHLRGLVGAVNDSWSNCSERPDAVTHAESKSGAYEILAEAATESRTVTVPATQVCRSVDELHNAVRAFGGSGRRLVAKSDFGVSGYGTCVIEPHWSSVEAVSGVWHHLKSASHRFCSWPIIVQEEVVRTLACPADLTGDGEVMADGTVALRGNATMLVDGNHYGGAVGACTSMIDTVHWRAISAYVGDVGGLLSDRGYRGWFDVDFLLGVDGMLYALEINARRTGPVAAFTLASRAQSIGLGRVAACRDAVPLPARYRPHEIFDVFSSLESVRAGRVVSTSFLGLQGDAPSIGLGAIGVNGTDAVRTLYAAIDSLLAALLARVATS